MKFEKIFINVEIIRNLKTKTNKKTNSCNYVHCIHHIHQCRLLHKIVHLLSLWRLCLTLLVCMAFVWLSLCRHQRLSNISMKDYFIPLNKTFSTLIVKSTCFLLAPAIKNKMEIFFIKSLCVRFSLWPK